MPSAWQVADTVPVKPLGQFVLHTLLGVAGLVQLNVTLTPAGAVGLPVHTAAKTGRQTAEACSSQPKQPLQHSCLPCAQADKHKQDAEGTHHGTRPATVPTPHGPT